MSDTLCQKTIEKERQQLLDHARLRDGTPIPEPVSSCPSGGAKKFDAGKPRMDLIPPVVLRLMADVLEFGTRKYGPNNWASGEGLPWSKLYAALQRHLNDWWEGKILDPETKKPALAHALCQLVFLLASEQHGLGTDDRFDWSHRKKEVVASSCAYCREPGHEPFCPTITKGTEFDGVSRRFYGLDEPPVSK